MTNIYDVIIIGAGPAGLFSALTIKNKSLLIIEKNHKPGRKLLISGAGQCNYTNYCTMDEILTKYGNKGRFLKPALYNFTNRDSIAFFENIGVKSFIREDLKVFPKSLKAQDILNALINCCKQNNVDFLYNTKVNSVSYDECLKEFIIEADEIYKSKILIICTGGKTYPITGSTGEGYSFAQDLGHSIQEPREALTAIYVKNYMFGDLSGLSFESISMTIWRNNKKTGEFRGDFLFTHKNISGPLIINNSRYIEAGDILRINFSGKPADEFKEFFENKLLSGGRYYLQTIMKEINLPKRFTEKVLELSGTDENILCSQLTKSNRKTIIELISNHSFVVEKLGGFHMAMVTRGGVSTNEINPKTMESKIINNLYFAGEVMDIDGETGGFNIQAAFSTGKLSGDNINKLK